MSSRQHDAPRTRYVWPFVASLLALVPFAGGFSGTNIFFVRDLAMYFWPRHVWTRHSLRHGDWPLWDPFAGGGQSAVADALNHFFLLPVTLVRILTPPVVGFNFWIAAPFPALAVGAWVWLARRVSAPAAFVGACLVCLSGPVVAAGNFPNLSWTIAVIPWILWSVDRLSERPGWGRLATLAVCVGFQAVAGEPVTFAATCALVATYSVAAPEAANWRQLRHRLTWIGLALAAGALLAAVQIVPLLFAASRSMRGVNIDHLFWSLHPLALVEVLVPHVFGHTYYANLETLPWVRPLNAGREPLFYSLYVGLAACVLALIQGSDPIVERWRRFWIAVCAIAVVCALGEYTFAYPAASSLIPVLKSFRFPVKYVVFASLALAVLAATGAETLLRHHRDRGLMRRPILAGAFVLLAGSMGAAFGVAGVSDADWMRAAWEALGRAVAVDDAPAAARWMGGASVLWLRLSAFAIVLTLLLGLAWQRHRLAPLAIWTMCALAVLDPLSVNADLHPTLPATRLGPPEWFEATRAHPQDRVYVGGRLGRNTGRQRGSVEMVDSPHKFQAPAEWSVQEALAMYAMQFVYTPAAWGIRELISYDLPQLWPREYVSMLRKVRGASPVERQRFLARTGTRYCFLPEPPQPGAEPLSAPAISAPMALYVCHTNPRRVYVTGQALVEPDLDRQLDLLFDEFHQPSSAVLLERDAPGPEGIAGRGAPEPAARVLREGNTELVVRTEIPAAGGYLNVVDSFDRFWTVDVDGRPATLLRANGLFRAVRLASGPHDVRFVYRPTPFYIGLTVTGAVSVMLLLGWIWERRRAAGVIPVVSQNEV